MRPIIEKQIWDTLPITSKHFEEISRFPMWRVITENEGLMHCMLRGEAIDMSFMNRSFPDIVGQFIDNLQNPEKGTQLNKFFNSLNIELKNHKILERYRKERDELIQYGENLVKNLSKVLIEMQNKLES